MCFSLSLFFFWQGYIVIKFIFNFKLVDLIIFILELYNQITFISDIFLRKLYLFRIDFGFGNEKENTF